MAPEPRIRRLGPYDLIAPLGAGGMGEVWRAFDPGLRRQVAIKILASNASRDPDRHRRFVQEAQAAGRLNHPNVLTVYAIGREGDTPYLVTELLEGMTLGDRLSGGPIGQRQVIEYGEQLLIGLSAAHEHGIVHRDLKPDNVFITSDDRVKILDFGLAKLTPSGTLQELETQTTPGLLLGTPAYMSPEQVRGETADHRSDIFAAGAILYEMLSGRRPFSGETAIQTMGAILNQDPPQLAGTSPDLAELVRHCLEKNPAARFQSTRDVAFQLQLLRQSGRPRFPRASLRHGRLAAAVGIVALVAGVIWWIIRAGPAESSLTFRRLTSDSGLSTDPVLSPDGQLVVYASDRAGANNLDIWRQQLATGEAVALTNDPADESEPAFSPDGTRIAFRSERDGGGLYVVSVFGGEPRLIAKDGRRPRFSADGSRIAYWVRRAPFYVGDVFIVPAAGGPPQQVQASFASATYPVWSPDGRSLLFVGAREPADIPSFNTDWWVDRLDGSAPIRTGALDIVRRQGMDATAMMPQLPIVPGAWIENDVLFSASSDQRANVWRLSLAVATSKAAGTVSRVTSGTSIETKPSALAGGRIVFASLTEHLNIWGVPIAPNRGDTSGPMEQVTTAAFDSQTSVSDDGRKLVFVSDRFGNPDVWIKDLVTGRETPLTATPEREEQPEITRDGTRVCYWVTDRTRHHIDTIDATGGAPEPICDGCGRPWDWSPDKTKILYLIPEGRPHAGLALGVLDVSTRQAGTYLGHASYSLARARFSPDGRWISFLALHSDGRSRVVVAPFDDSAPPAEDTWITVKDEPRAVLEKPRWSPDGNLLYYLSDIDGFRCLWAQRLDPVSKRPVGTTQAVYHLHGARRSLTNVWLGSIEISLGPDKLFFNLGETTGNIWLAEPKR